MKSLIKIVVFCLLISMQNCCGPGPDPAPVLAVQLYYKTQEGADLFSPKTTGYYDKNAIKVSNFWIDKNGLQTTTPAYITSYNSCDSLVCNSINGHFVAFNEANGFYNVDNFVVAGSLVNLSPGLTDTLTYDTSPVNGGFTITKIFYRKKLIWSTPAVLSSEGIEVTIVK